MADPRPVATPLRYYQVLGVPPGSSLAVIRQAYRRLSKRYHPDTSGLPPEQAIRRFQDLQEAYGILNNPTLKATCDAVLAELAVQSSPDASTELSQDPPTWRDFSGGEIFVLALFGITFMVCGVLVGVLSVGHPPD
ncbi:MAG: J domain-containing protein [Synechococcales cyanobacterium]